VRITISTKRILYILCIFSIACTFMLSACSSSAATAKEGDTVKVLYVGTYDNGSVFDSSESHGGEPLQFTIGGGDMIPGFEQAVIGMTKNETKKVHISAEAAYGPYYDYMVMTVNWSSFDEGFVPEVGEQLQMQNSLGQTFQGTVLNTSEEGVTIDFNSPMAGKDLNFEITMVEIVPASK
jgi:peptidylprolyl isomerase